MSEQSLLLERLYRVLTTPTDGVLGLVDELLFVSQAHDLQLNWQEGICHAKFGKADSPDQLEARIPKPVIRAALARIAALCNERIPNSVSPYGGIGEIVVDGNPTVFIGVQFTNTPELQTLELSASRNEARRSPSGFEKLSVPTDLRPAERV